MERYRRMGYDAHAIVRRYDEYVEDAAWPGFATLLIDLLAECGMGGGEPSGPARIMAP